MKRRIVAFVLLILLSVLTMTVFFACNEEPLDGDTTNRTLKAMSVEGVDKNNPIVLYKGDVFDPSKYTLNIVLDNDAELSLPVNNGMFRNADELALIGELGNHSLTLTYTLNSSELSILIDIVVKERVVEQPKFDVTFDMGDGIAYAEQIRQRNVSSLSTLQITYTDPTKSYMTAEWYTTPTFASISKIIFPYEVKEDQTIYAKWVDNRRVTVEYYITRILEGNVVDKSGDVTTRDKLEAESILTVTNLKVQDAITATALTDFVQLPTTPSTNVAGYTFTSVWEVYDYTTNSYRALTQDSLGGKLDFYISENYIADKSALLSTIKVYCIYHINRYKLTFKDADGVYSLTKDASLTVVDGKLNIGSNQYIIDEFNNVAIDGNEYHIVGSDVYRMSPIQSATIDVSGGTGTVVIDGTTYYIDKGKAYLDQDYTTALVGNVIGATPTYYIHTPYLEKPHNYAISQTTMPYILYKIDSQGSWLVGSEPLEYTYYVSSDVEFVAKYTIKTYLVSFTLYNGNIGAFTKNHGNQITLDDFTLAGIKLSAESGYTFSWSDGTTTYSSNADLVGKVVVNKIDFVEVRTPNTYTNTFKYGSTNNYIVKTPENQFSNTITAPTTAEIRAALPQFDHDYYYFEWYRDAVYTDSTMLLETDTQPSGNNTFYLKAIDRRTFDVTFVVEATYSKTNQDAFATTTIAINGIYPILADELGLMYKPEYVEDPANFNIDGALTTSTITFDDSFITALGDKLHYEPSTFTYSATVVLTAKTRMITINFIDELEGTSIEETFAYDAVPTISYDTAARPKEDGKIYHFAGWYNISKTVYYKTFDNATEDVSYVAVWRSEEDGSFGIGYVPILGEDGSTIAFAMDSYVGHNDEVYVGSTHEGKPVTSITERAFCIGKSNLDLEIISITIPASITDIAEGAFVECPSLQEIKVSAGSTSYMSTTDGVLYKINSATDYTLVAYPGAKETATYTVDPNTKAIAADAFSLYKGASIDLGGVVNIGDRAFKGASLTSIDIPNTVKTLGAEAFKNCANLSSVNVDTAAITKVGKEAFANTLWISAQTGDEIMLGDKVLLQYVGTADSYTLLDSVTTIADRAFAGKYELKSLTIGQDSALVVGNIGIGVFTDSGLVSVTIANTALKDAIIALKDAIFIGTSSTLTIN